MKMQIASADFHLSKKSKTSRERAFFLSKNITDSKQPANMSTREYIHNHYITKFLRIKICS